MGKWVSFWKNLSRSLLRIVLLLLIAVVSLLVLVMFYSAVNDDIPSNISIIGFVHYVIDGDVPPVKDYTPPIFDPRLLHGYNDSSHSFVKKPTLLESLWGSLSDLYYNWKDEHCGPPGEFMEERYRYKPMFTEKIVVFNPLMIDWDNKLAEFKEKTGFKGEIDKNILRYSGYKRVRSFNNLSGTFNLTEPKDTVTFRRNADFLVKNILAMYDEDKDKIHLFNNHIIVSPGVYTGKPALSFIVYYYQIFDADSTSREEGFSHFCLVVDYEIKAKKYSIQNSLFEMTSTLPKDKAGKNDALILAQKDLLQRKNYRAYALAKLKTMIWKEYIIIYPETRYVYYYYVQSVWHISFPNVRTSSNKILWFYVSDEDEYTVDAYNGKVKKHTDDYKN